MSSHDVEPIVHGVLDRAHASNASDAAGAIDEEAVQLLVFGLADQRFGVRLRDVETVTPPVRVAAVPGVPEHVLGVIAYRGAIIPVVDLAALLGIGDGAERHPVAMAIVAVDGVPSGVACPLGSLDDIKTVPLASVQPPLSTLEGSKAQYIEGEIHDAGSLITILQLKGLATQTPAV